MPTGQCIAQSSFEKFLFVVVGNEHKDSSLAKVQRVRMTGELWTPNGPSLQYPFHEDPGIIAEKVVERV